LGEGQGDREAFGNDFATENESQKHVFGVKNQMRMGMMM
jgi:hypothetical protein